MMNGPRKSLFTRLKPLRLLGFTVILLGFVWFVWKHLPATVSVSDAPVSATVERVYLGPPNSLAVLSFSPGADDKTPEYLSRGFARELAELLVAEPSLQLTATTSSLFPDAGMEDPDIAAQRLQVAYLVTGTIVLAGDRIRLEAGLWDARRKEMAWEASRESGLREIDVLLNEVSAALLEQLPITRRGQTLAYGRVSPEAWLAYLQGRDLAAQGSFGAAMNLIDRAIELQPRYSAAQLERARLVLAASPPGRDEALAGIEGIPGDDPLFSRGLGLRSYIERNLDWNWAAAADSATNAVRLLPGNASLRNLAGQALFSAGRHHDAVDHFSKAVVRDPLNLNIRLGLGLAQEYLGQYDEALKTYRVLLGMKPDFPGAHAFRARIKLLQENPDSALRESEQENNPFWKKYSRVLALAGQGKPDEAVEQWEDLIAGHGDSAAFQFAEIAAYLGRIDESFNWLETARLHRDAGMRELLGNRFLTPLHGDSRWPELLNELGFPLDSDRLND